MLLGFKPLPAFPGLEDARVAQAWVGESRRKPRSYQRAEAMRDEHRKNCLIVKGVLIINTNY